MPLVNCSACDQLISTAAEACPGCGHPNPLVKKPVPAGPKCYACPATATTRCQSCGALSCVEHVYATSVPRGRSSVNELCCNDCRIFAIGC